MGGKALGFGSPRQILSLIRSDSQAAPDGWVVSAALARDLQKEDGGGKVPSSPAPTEVGGPNSRREGCGEGAIC